MITITVTVNNVEYELDVAPHHTLLAVLKDQLGFTEIKSGCGEGECGACTVLLDGKPVTSCILPAVKADGRKVTTIKGLARDGALHPLQEKFIEHGAVQCGYCSPGMILSAKALLDANPHPSEHEIRMAISGNICRCTGYQQIVEAIAAAASED